mgnify:CR=1 FL=1
MRRERLELSEATKIYAQISTNSLYNPRRCSIHTHCVYYSQLFYNFCLVTWWSHRMRVEVYWNLNKKSWSVRALEGERKGKVVGHIDKLILRDCQFVVQPGGQKRTRKTGQKNVHAFIRGHIDGYHLPFPEKSRQVTYNPFRNDSFIEKDSREPIHSADQTYFQITDSKPEVAAVNTRKENAQHPAHK